MNKKWQIQIEFKTRSPKPKIDDIVKVLLENRGLKTKEEVDEFLNPKLEKVTTPSVGINKVQLQKALKRIKQAIEKKEKIVIFGDYDVDGICGTAILWETIYQFTDKVWPYIPHRVDEGYGLSTKAIQSSEFRVQNPKLIITVDNGVVANEAVEYANKQGIDVIITDHHVPSKKLPKAYSIVHTNKLCGTGVAYMLAQEISKAQNDHLALVALATVADLVPLQGANRTLLKFGLEQLQKSKRVGILELCKEAAIDVSKIGTYEIGHVIAPRLNAMGRLEYAMESLRLICTKDQKRAEKLAMLLGSTNKERQVLTAETVSHAITEIRNKRQATSNKLLFISHETYQPGVIGLVAGRLVEEFYLPSIVVSKGETHSKASARSISGFNIIDFIRGASELLVDVGGHPMAAGFTVETSKLEELSQKLHAVAKELLKDELLQRTIKIDCEIPLDIISKDLLNALERLAPFGMSNPVPTFMSRDVQLTDIRFVGKENQHVKLRIQSSEFRIEGIGFGLGERTAEFKIGNRVDIVYTIDENEWNGSKSLQLKVKDIRSSQN